MNDDDRRAYEREKKRRQRAAGRGQILSPSGDITGTSRGHEGTNSGTSWGQIGDKILFRLDEIMSELAWIEQQILGVLSPVPPSKGDRGTGTPLGTGTCPQGTSERDSQVVPRDMGTGDKGTSGDNPLIPARTWPDPRRTQDHVDAADNGIAAAREALDRNRWHPAKGPRP